jgi:glycopeptide antibiotics resistance protein
MQHAISGYLSLIPALSLYFAVLSLRGKRQTCSHIVLSFVFCFYVIGIWAATGVWWIGSFSPRTDWIPFAGMMRGTILTALNVLLFTPLGFLLPVLYKEIDRAGKIATAGFLFSLSVEIMQMFGTGTSDINDLITNTAGACLGYGIYRSARRAIPGLQSRTISVSGAQCYYELAGYWLLALLMMTTVQSKVFHLLF